MITGIFGPMFGGKSTELVKIYKQELKFDRKVAAFKPELDTRDTNMIKTHDGKVIEANIIRNFTDGQKCFEYDTVLFDEFQFFKPFIIDLVKSLSLSGKWVVCAGLDHWWTKEPTERYLDLMNKTGVTDLRKPRGKCRFCGATAVWTDKLTADNKLIDCGGKGKYVPTCDCCYGLTRGEI